MVSKQVEYVSSQIFYAANNCSSEQPQGLANYFNSLFGAGAAYADSAGRTVLQGDYLVAFSVAAFDADVPANMTRGVNMRACTNAWAVYVEHTSRFMGCQSMCWWSKQLSASAHLGASWHIEKVTINCTIPPRSRKNSWHLLPALCRRGVFLCARPSRRGRPWWHQLHV